ncbi:CHAT domain-containing protein [Phaeobacter inhibens]|uniref:CHAT domain-containing protein n=1 Tax=Phaeobacter inhibens TaxID=221822 RepID=UPI0021A3A6BE|nr:CHAT domain-containing protein [Phaeobacter inhibens]UWR73179.1 CHAT domain-containing protein [Phaeobacter inhibens]
MLNADPLKIVYLLVMDDTTFESMSPFQGFGASWFDLHWAMQLIVHLPGDVAERSHSLEAIAPQRIAGLRPFIWQPINVSALEQVPPQFFPPCTVAFSGNSAVADRVDRYLGEEKTLLHFPYDKAVNLTVEEITNDLRDFCFLRLWESSDILNPDQQRLVANLEENWRRPEVEFQSLKIRGHNVSLPNYMALQRIGFRLEEAETFVGAKEKEYTDLILETAGAVRHIRQEARAEGKDLPELPTPNLIIFEPALFRQRYKNSKPASGIEVEIHKALKFFQKQKGLHNSVSKEQFDRMMSSAGTFISEIRSGELVTQTLGVGLYAAASTSPVIRLSPAVNHVHNKLTFFARSVRSENAQAKRKASRLFQDIQQSLAAGIGPDRLRAISLTSAPIKIIADAPLEWLPLDGVPLSLIKNCSRIPVTPGNVMMSQLIPSQPMTLYPDAIDKILVVSSFTEDDPLRYMLRDALESTKHLWGGKLSIEQVFVSSAQEFEDALNGFDGSILIYDGHGAANDLTPVGTVLLEKQKFDVWDLRGRVRCPPIVILSACDTQGVDASTHATVANGFLALGATSVLGTFLPVGGFSSAVFVARLMHRLAEYIPAMLKAVEHPLSWLEVIAGMLRMTVATEIINELAGVHGAIQTRQKANIDINSRRTDWFERLVQNLVSETGDEPARVRKKALAAIARSDAIRYTHLGNPERICFFE